MSKRLGPVAYHLSEEHPFLGKEIHEQRQFSEHTAQLIDEEVATLLHQSADEATTILIQNRDKLVAIAEALIDREILDDLEITELIGPPATVDEKSVKVETSDSLSSTPPI
jgi:cell division protease FtsH